MVFHWPRESMDRLGLAELIDWREEARLRWEKSNGQ